MKMERSESFNVQVTKTTEMSRLRILKNLLVVCLGFLFLFSAYQALANLQSTLNMEDNLGIVSQSVIYVSLIISSLFLPKLVIRKIGCKYTLALSILLYAPYVAMNFYPGMATFVPSAILVGIGAAPLWSAKCTYLNEISTLYSKYTSDTTDVITSRFFGIFFMVFQNTQIWGNLVSFYILQPGSSTGNVSASMDIPEDIELDSNVTWICGIHYCGGMSDNLKPPAEKQRYMLIGVFLACTILASLIVAFFLDTLETKNADDRQESVISHIGATLKHLKNIDQILLMPLTVFSGIEQAMILGDFTRAYVACAWGIHYVGLVFICFGVVNSAVSFFVGRLVRHLPRVCLMVTAALGNLGTCLVLFLWLPSSDQYSIFFVIVGVWGLSDAIWQTQINALYAILFRSEEEAAFANYRLWESLGFALAFGYSTLLCMEHKIDILLGMLAIGMGGYITVEFRNRRCEKIQTFELQTTSSNL